MVARAGVIGALLSLSFGELPQVAAPSLAAAPTPALLQALGLQAAQLAIVGIVTAIGAITAAGTNPRGALAAPESCQEIARTAPALDILLCGGCAYLTLVATFRHVAP